MSAGPRIEKRRTAVRLREHIAHAGSSSDDDFVTWRDDARDVDAAFVRGSWDFMIHVAQPAANYICMPENKTVLELGHGRGRILAAAARSFKTAIGVDVHDFNDKVLRELGRRGIRNVELLKTDGANLPIPDDTADMVYSFIVLRDIESIQMLDEYLRESRRVLMPNGIAVLHFGRFAECSENGQSRPAYYADGCIETALRRNGYDGIRARLNHQNAMVSMLHAKNSARSAGFAVLQELVSHKRAPDGTGSYEGRHGFVLRKVSR